MFTGEKATPGHLTIKNDVGMWMTSQEKNVLFLNKCRASWLSSCLKMSAYITYVSNLFIYFIYLERAGSFYTHKTKLLGHRLLKKSCLFVFLSNLFWKAFKIKRQKYTKWKEKTFHGNVNLNNTCQPFLQVSILSVVKKWFLSRLSLKWPLQKNQWVTILPLWYPLLRIH